MENGQNINNDSVEIHVPYPCSIDPKDFLSHKCKEGKKPSKSSNAFMIYRKMFSRELKKKNYKVTQAKISGMASASWKKESNHIKDAYHKLAGDVDRLFMELRQDNPNENPIERVDASKESAELTPISNQFPNVSADNISSLYLSAPIPQYYWPIPAFDTWQYTYDVTNMTYYITSIYDNN
ncbi:17588_t:CDS:1 [Dentiscutata erythropus]|uniref:17588_t:CDS:1 n=1 Tax=Dentiscutata erythropus TaxID=1348616 RepID=A0A9N9FR86_9GLOM|nr:17588_t:CDS:1 [Dentiscutata erythropus]